jgi:hypothetical protein
MWLAAPLTFFHLVSCTTHGYSFSLNRLKPMVNIRTINRNIKQIVNFAAQEYEYVCMYVCRGTRWRSG